ncbi:MAG: TetR/AcrR family transcriptional regulator [Phenylobacterium sp.]|uniref:TetR/AcrR family transcriptional regulator n=1 Tax=Phenylobacterium sp. TaxID=1871053 RepID=UPI001B77F986|nr:TetR/AcrR family transcriptional regulator [Phenylobacterium sp.]MBP7651052.1 TetR/AcrR family transcriptional regulator [Phenylobacterium sp.]MBP7817278.1 TetR/AcrR family transcriptional regulator [Phenylobacterium sp.]MBP9232843.1 TetR/AcrR family transcriptional regulator [Phenylobacterium sp.]MBP9755341.1 TetR/AcrR family transcriptional regulator [Phenylobacterium sp.]
MSLPAGQPKFRRRKADRPDEIVAAAFEVFGEKGFAAARLDDIAARAGVSKGAIYLYFATKEDIFQAVVEQGVAPNLHNLAALTAANPQTFPDLIRAFAKVMAQVTSTTPLGGILKMVIGEARNFPELARVWHDRLIFPALGALSAAIAAAQARGEIRPGDPRQYAVSLIAPMLVGVIWRETFTPIGAEPFDLPALMEQHVETLLRGMVP